jgi:hypothetical protein
MTGADAAVPGCPPALPARERIIAYVGTAHTVSSVREPITHPEDDMRLRDSDQLTLALVKMGLTLDQRDGVLLSDEAAEENFFFTAEIAPQHHLYIELHNNDHHIGIDVGIFRRPRQHISQMIRANYPGFRIWTDPLGLAGTVGGYVEDLDPADLAAYHQASDDYLRRDLAINAEHGIEV